MHLISSFDLYLYKFNFRYILVFKPDGKNSYKARNLDEVELVGGITLNLYLINLFVTKYVLVPGVLNETLQRACLKNCSTFPY